MNHVSSADPITRARDLGPAIEAAAATIEQSQRIGEPLLTRLHEARLLRLLLPRRFAGEEVEPWVYLHAVEEASRHDASVGWNLFVANSSALIAPFMEPAAAHAIFDDPRALVAWGPPNAARARAVPGGYRISGEWEFRQRLPPGHLDGRARPGRGTGRRAAAERGRKAVDAHAAVPGRAGAADRRWNVIGLRGTASDAYSLSDLFVPEAFSATREEPEARREPGRLYAFTMQGLYAVGDTGVVFGVARAMLDAFVALALRKTPRNLGRLADSAVVQSNLAQVEAKLGAARAYLEATLREVWASAEGVAAIDIPARARVRLACAHAIQTALETADFAYKEAGTSAIFLDTAFERRFRDIHTASQQIQARGAHFEAVGRIMLGTIPEVFY